MARFVLIVAGLIIGFLECFRAHGRVPESAASTVFAPKRSHLRLV